MRRTTVALFCVFFALVLVVPASGGGMEISGVGARAKGMGGAFRAISDDWSAAYYNPAGLYYVTENQLSFNEVMTNYQFEYTPLVKYDGYGVGYYDGLIHNRYEILTNPTLGGFFKLPVEGRNVVTGLAIFQPFDMNVSWSVFQPLNNELFSLPGQQIEHNFDAVAFNWTGAVELMENRMSAGWSVGLLKADLVYGGFFLRPTPADPESWYYDQVASRPNDLVTEWQKSDGNGFAPNFRFGLLYKPTPKINVGASYAFKTTVTVDGNTDFYYYMPYNFTFNSRENVKTYPDSIFYILSSGARIQGYSKFETKITLPAQLAGGVSYKVNDKLTVAGDLEYTFWSQFKGYRFDYTFEDQVSYNSTLDSWLKESMVLPVDWKNTLKGSIGAEYIYSRLLSVRCGYMADQSPAKSGTLHPAFFDPGLKHTFCLGLGFKFENVILDFATQYTSYPESREGGNTYITSDGIVDNMAGTYSGSAWESIAQFTVRF